MPEQLVTNLGSSNEDNLFAGGVSPVVTDGITLAVGQVYLRGTVLALKPDGKATIVNSAALDSTKTPYAILADNIDATSADEPGGVYLTGEFNQTVLIFGGTDTFEKHKQKLREIGIFLKDVVKA